MSYNVPDSINEKLDLSKVNTDFAEKAESLSTSIYPGDAPTVYASPQMCAVQHKTTKNRWLETLYWPSFFARHAVSVQSAKDIRQWSRTSP